MALLRCHRSRSPLGLHSSRLASDFLRTGRVYASSFSTPGPPVVSTTWVDRLPPKVQPYLYLTRIDKPIGTLLLFYPCGASIDPLDTFGEPRDDVSPCSLVHHHGLIRAQRATHRPPDIHRPIRHRRSDNARRGMHNQ